MPGFRRLPYHLQLACGLFLGIVVTSLFMEYQDVMPNEGSQISLKQRGAFLSGLAGQLVGHTHGDEDHSQDHIRPVQFNDAEMHDDDDHIARQLASSQRVLCWVMTAPNFLHVRADQVRHTWGKRCNKLLFMSSQWNSSFPTIGLNVSEGRQHLTAKTMEAFRYVYHNHFDDADWFLKADDDTYIIMENLRYFVSSLDTKEPIYSGHVNDKQVYPCGGGGYVLSKEALRRLAVHGSNPSLCSQNGGDVDNNFGKCMEKIGVRMVSSLDRLGRSRFHCSEPMIQIHQKYVHEFYYFDPGIAKQGVNNISDYAISFNVIRAHVITMYVMEFYVYHLRPYGLIPRFQAQDTNHKTGQTG